jgi:hypothetical protein
MKESVMAESTENDAGHSAELAVLEERDWIRQLDEVGLDRVMQIHARSDSQQDPLRWNWTENWILRRLEARVAAQRAEKEHDKQLQQEALAEQKRHNAKTRMISFIALVVAVLSFAWNAYGGRV